jgi:glycosyltransferase involved in cell wall biosynthesis
MRVAHFLMGRCNPESPNGVDKTVYYLSRAQAALGAEVAVLSISDKQPIPIDGVDARTYPPTLPRIPLPPRMADLALDRSPLNLPARLVQDLLALDPGIVHFHFVHIPQSIRLARRISSARRPYCVSPNGGLSGRALHRRALGKRLFGALFERRYLERAAFVHVVSGADTDGLRSYGVHTTAVMAPNCIDLSAVPVDLVQGEHSQKPSHEEGSRLMLFLGRLDPDQKGLDLLLDAMAIARNGSFRLVLAGPDWRGGRTQLGEKVRSLGLSDRISFTGPLIGRDKWDLLARADVFVHPSRWEAGIPFSVLEAMAVARPLVLTEAADPQGLAEGSGAAVKVAPDPESIAQGLQELARKSDGELSTMGMAARRLAEQQFSWARTAQTLLDAYEDVVAGRSPRDAFPVA